jgi:hypothetical protein
MRVLFVTRNRVHLIGLALLLAVAALGCGASAGTPGGVDQFGDELKGGGGSKAKTNNGNHSGQAGAPGLKDDHGGGNAGDHGGGKAGDNGGGKAGDHGGGKAGHGAKGGDGADDMDTDADEGTAGDGDTNTDETM